MAYKIKQNILFAGVIGAALISFSSVCLAGSITGKVTTFKVKSPKDVVVYIDNVKGEFPPPEKTVEMDQISLKFVPHILPVVKGTTVGFRNSDNVLHNVFAVGEDEFDLGTWKGKEDVRTYTFNKLGEEAVLCNVHPEMEAYILVLQNPYFALTDETGSYEIKDVPAGTYKLKTWHERLRPVTKDVTVPAAGSVTVDIEANK